ncbi:SDR family oxidoreductase [Alteromonas genovensis]|jgi:NAD(P)-dependent dehydrogenase (short-subunit alcohol dehydrogenase family)|uniref:SDR family oxidoreductase n=1 Tax=Alteromonas genovensis TaxID=471225 RepID=A0A6N9TIU6_9ALTE|nr:SDR family NAD(P)-dependent oxidoreductase [Alteromonas genovensis]NDW16422.1 SDR family oxidoreductase [Alteromonas genovensis]
MLLTNLTAIVTGGCSGLGHATAVALRGAGVKVSLFDLNNEQGAQRVSELGEEGTLFSHVDVRDEEQVQRGIDATTAKFGAISMVVNCAGIAPAKRLLDREGNPAPLGDFQKTIDINLVGSFNVARLVAATMAKQSPINDEGERGLIINTASVAGYEGQIGQTAYAASKGGIIGLTLPMARDLAPLGIRVNTIAPGVMGTPMLLAMPEKVQEALSANVQFPKRLGLPEEFAKLVMQIADNTYINGETIRLDGGLRMPPK